MAISPEQPAPLDQSSGGSRAHPGAAGRIPDFFVVGHGKSGTTALYEMLRSHPEIFMCEVKEPRFFATDLRSRFAPRAHARHPRTLDRYLELFEGARPDQRVGEASPQYLRSRAAPANIAELQPSARIIAILREPASYLHSYHMQMVTSNVESERSFEKALTLEGYRRLGKRVPRNCHHAGWLFYSENVRYTEQLRRYHAVFGPEQVLVLIYDDFRADNDTTVRQVLRFLEVNENAPIQTLDAHPSTQVRSRHLQELLPSISHGRGPIAGHAKTAIKTLTSQRLRHNLIKMARRKVIYGKPDPADEQLMQQIRRTHKNEVEELSNYLDRDLVTQWGYDNLD